MKIRLSVLRKGVQLGWGFLTNAHITGIVGAVQDLISGEAKGELFADIQKCVTGQMSAEAAVEAAIRLNEEQYAS